MTDENLKVGINRNGCKFVKSRLENRHIQIVLYYPKRDNLEKIYAKWEEDEYGKKDGLFESWYKNGQLWERSPYKHGIRNGLCEEYYMNGMLRCRCFFRGENCVLDGPFERRFENGAIKQKGRFVDGEFIFDDMLAKKKIKVGRLLRKLKEPQGPKAKRVKKEENFGRGLWKNISERFIRRRENY